jgi:hypothetical protein
LDTTPEIKFFESVREYSALARRRTRDSAEAQAALDLEIDMERRIKKLRAALRAEPFAVAGGGE